MLVIFACFNFSCVTCALNPSFLCLNKNLAENPDAYIYIVDLITMILVFLHASGSKKVG